MEDSTTIPLAETLNGETLGFSNAQEIGFPEKKNMSFSNITKTIILRHKNEYKCEIWCHFKGSQNDSFQSFFFGDSIESFAIYIMRGNMIWVWMQIPSGFLIYAEEAKPSINQDSCQDSSYGECSSSTY